MSDLKTRETSTFNMMIYELEPKWSVVCKIAETSFIETDINDWGKVTVPKTGRVVRKPD